MSPERDVIPDGTCGFDVAAYALGALEPHEASQLRAHIGECAICRDELSAFELVTSMLPLAVAPVRPTRALRRRLLSEVQAEARLADHAAGAVTRSRRAAERPRWLPDFGAAAGRPALGLACAATIAIAAVFGTGALSSGSPVSRQYAAKVYGLPGSAQLKVRDGHGQLVVDHLPAAKPGHVYEVWLQHSANGPDEPTPVLFNAGSATVSVPGDMTHVHSVLVTQEPAGGTAVPTTSPVIVASLA